MTIRPLPALAFAAIAASLVATPLAASRRAADGARQTGTIDDTLLETARSIQRDIEEIRGLEFTSDVEFERIDPDGVDAFVRREVDRQGGPERMAFQTDAARLLGWAEPADDLLDKVVSMLREQVAGLYDPVSKRFFLASGLPDSLVRVTLAHELVHALDDQHYDLGAKILERRHDSDRAWGLHAAVEGSATVVHTRWMIANMGSFSPGEMAAIQEQGTKGMATTPDYLWKPMVGTYLFGAAFLNRTQSVAAGQMRRPPAEDIDRAMREPPQSSEQILHPQKYWDEAQFDAPIAVGLAVPSLPAGWSSMGEDTFGELGLALALDPRAGAASFQPMALMRLRLTNDAAAGWGGDRYVVLAQENGARALVAEIVFDEEKDVAEFRDAVATVAEWRSERLAALARAIGGDGAPHAQWLETGAGPLAVRWVLAAGIDEEAARDLSRRVSAR